MPNEYANGHAPKRWPFKDFWKLPLLGSNQDSPDPESRAPAVGTGRTGTAPVDTGPNRAQTGPNGQGTAVSIPDICPDTGVRGVGAAGWALEAQRLHAARLL